jgi:hypothetical protein
MAIVDPEQRINGLPVVREVDGGRHTVALGHLVEVAHLVARLPKVGDDRSPEFSASACDRNPHDPSLSLPMEVADNADALARALLWRLPPIPERRLTTRLRCGHE